MKYDKKTATVLLVLLLVVCLANLFYVTQPDILDTDPSTYVIVPLIMLPVLAVFTMKGRFSISPGRRDIAIGAACFAALLVLNTYLRIAFSYEFLSYGIEMLVFPLMIASLIALLFGADNIKRFKLLLIYTLLCAPVLILPILSQNQGFAVANTYLIYNMAKPFVHNLTYDGMDTISAGSYNISIGQACVGIGALIGLILFLIPLAYFYDGRMGRKMYWVIGGAALFLVLNLLRMFFITVDWLFYGPSTAILTIHLFVGILIFYLSLLVMVLLAGRFGLSLPRLRNEKQGKKQRAGNAGIAIAIILSMVYFAFSANYSSALYLSPLYLSSQGQINFTNTYTEQTIGALVSISNASSTEIVAANGSSTAILLSNSTIQQSDPVIALFRNERVTSMPIFTGNQTPTGQYIFINNDSTVAYVYSLETNGSTIYAYHTVIPYIAQSGQFYSIGAYLIIPSYVLGEPRCSSFDPLYTPVSNLFNQGYYNATSRNGAYAAYCFGRKALS